MNDPLCKVSSFISMHDGQMWPHYMKWNVCVGGKKNASVFPHRWWWWGWFKLCVCVGGGDTHWSVVSCQDWVTGIFRRRGRTHAPAVKGNDCACRAHCNSAAASCQLRPRHLGKRGTVVKNHFLWGAVCVIFPPRHTHWLHDLRTVSKSACRGSVFPLLRHLCTGAVAHCNALLGGFKEDEISTATSPCVYVCAKNRPASITSPSIIDPPPLNVFLQAHAASPQSLCLTVTVEG